MRKAPFTAVIAAVIICLSGIAGAQELTTIKLPAPVMSGGMPLMEALKERQTSRSYDPAREIPLNVMSNLLWAAFGINRPDSGRRTAPSAVNWQEIDIYVVTAKGTYFYDAKEHSLKPHAAGDHRAATGSQDFVGIAPLNLVFVADLTRMGKAPESDLEKTAMADTGFISQNVYLFCASEGLATVVRGLVDKPALSALLKLRPEQRITLAQTIGYPK